MPVSRALIFLVSLLLLAPAQAAAHAECMAGWACPFSSVERFGGPALTKVHEPVGLAVAPDGRIAVADFGAHRTLVLAADGTPIRALDDEGSGRWVGAVAFDAAGNLYTAAGGHIRRYGPDYELQLDITEGLLRGDPAAGQHYTTVRSMAVDTDGRLFALADEVILVYRADGGLERELRRPGGDFSRDGTLVAAGDGRLLVGDVAQGRIEELRADGSFVRAITAVPPGASLLEMAMDDAGGLHVPGAQEIWTYDRSGNHVATTPHELQWSQGALAVTPAGYILAEPDRLARLDRTGAPLAPFGTDPGTGLSRPRSLDVTADGRSVVADAGNHRIVSLGADGRFDRVLAARPGDRPLSVALLPDDDVLVAWDSGLVERRSWSGDVGASWQVPGSPLLTGASAAADGTVWLRDRAALLNFTREGALLARLEVGLQSTFAAGNGLDVGPDGNLYAAEPYKVAKVAPDGRVLARYDAPLAEGVEVLANGGMVVAAQREVRLMAPDGRLVTSWGDHGTPAGHLHLPWDVAVDGTSRFLVTDHSGHALYRFTFKAPAGTGNGRPGPAAPLAPVALVPPVGPLRAGRAGTVRVTLDCSSAEPCTGDVRLRGRRAAGAARVLASASFRIPGRRRSAVRLRLRPAARRGVRQGRRIRARLHVRPAVGPGFRRAVVLARRVR